MRIDIDTVGDVIIIDIPLESLDASNTNAFRDAVDTWIDEDKRIVFDLSHVTFVDSSGLGVLLSCLRDLNAMGGDAKLCGMINSVQQMFALVRMDRVFDIHPTRTEAIGSFS